MSAVFFGGESTQTKLIITERQRFLPKDYPTPHDHVDILLREVSSAQRVDPARRGCLSITPLNSSLKPVFISFVLSRHPVLSNVAPPWLTVPRVNTTGNISLTSKRNLPKSALSLFPTKRFRYVFVYPDSGSFVY